MQHYFPFIFTYNSQCLDESDSEEINLLSLCTGTFEALREKVTFFSRSLIKCIIESCYCHCFFINLTKIGTRRLVLNIKQLNFMEKFKFCDFH